MTTMQLPIEQRFVLEGVDWAFYELLLQQVGDRHIFITYDRGRLELMAPSYRHDRSAEAIGSLVAVLAEELNIPFAAAGSTTFRRADLNRGLEPDKCFYLANEPRVRGKREINLDVDPPPDLAVEVEISRRLLDREAIYADLGVSELWRYDGTRLSAWQLREDGTYGRTSRSLAFPSLPLDQAERFLAEFHEIDQTTWMRTLRAWVRRELVRA